MIDVDKFERRLDLLSSLRDLLYAMPNCECGGPLHIILDDGNVRDSDIAFCRKEIENEEWNYVRELCVCILDILNTLSPAQRLYWWEYMPLENIIGVTAHDIIITENGYKIDSKSQYIRKIQEN